MSLAELGEAFKMARIRARKTQREVADETGMTRTRVSMFESGALSEFGAAKMLSLFESVGLELFARPLGHGRTLDDVLRESAEQPHGDISRTRVRHSAR